MSWRQRGACVGVDPALFFPDIGDTGRHAKAVCAGCVVRVECLNHALEHREDEGIWGGLSRIERRALPRPRRRPVAECGTEAGYRGHRRRGEDACRSCREAHTAYVSEQKRRGRERRSSQAGDGTVAA